MIDKFASVVLITALVCTLGGSSAFASNPSQPDTKPGMAKTRSESGAATKEGAQPNERLRADMVKLVTDAKAGKVAPAERPQIQPAKSNNLSKGTKIAIGVGIAVAVVAVVLIARSPILNDGR